MFFAGVLFGLLTLIFVAVLWMRRQYSIWKQMGAPYEKPTFFYGNLRHVKEQDHDGHFTRQFYTKYKSKGPFVGIFHFLTPVAIATDMRLIQNILTTDFESFHDRGVYHNGKDDPLSAHLFALPGLKWRRLRTNVSPTFSNAKMKMMLPTLGNVASKFENIIEKVSATGHAVCMRNILTRFAIDVIGTCVFGLDCNSLEDEANEFYHVGVSVFRKPRHGTAVQLFLNAFSDIGQRLHIKFFTNDVINFYTNTVREIIDYRVQNHVRRNDFMNLLLQMYQSDGDDRITFDELLAQAFAFHIGGFQTSSTTMEFCLYLLARYDDIQVKTRSHINEVLDRHNGQLTYEALQEMKYLDQVINETLRLFPPLSNLMRIVTKDYQIRDTNFRLQKGTPVLIPVYAIHRDPDFYPNPDVFNPDNFSEEKIRQRPCGHFLPFGDGPRLCVGARFGMMQTKVGIVTALRKFRYRLSSMTTDPLELRTNFLVAYAEGGIWLRIRAVGL